MKILHIEDQDHFINEVKNFIKNKKEIIIKDEITTNIEAIETLKNDNYDIIILDGNLLDGKSTPIIDWLIEKNYNKEKVILHSNDIPFLMNAHKKGFTKIYQKNDNSFFKEVEKSLQETN